MERIAKKTKNSNPWEELMEELFVFVKDALKANELSLHITRDLFEIPPDQNLGDVALRCFTLSKEFKKSPIAIAVDIASTINAAAHPLLTTVAAAGPYVNFSFDPSYVANRVVPMVLHEKKFGELRAVDTKPIVLEYVSPNTNKPLHLGHMRNGFLGDSISRLLKATGHIVHKTCLINDRGIHICKSMIAYQIQESKVKGQAVPTPKRTKKKGDHFVGDYYVLFEKMAKEDPTIIDHARTCLQLWEKGDAKTRILWKKMNSWVVAGFLQTFKTLGISFDKMYRESAIYSEGREIIQKALAQGVVKKDKTGAVYIELEPYGLPNKILLRSDGTTLYITQDMYLAYKRQKDFKSARTLYVVGSEQDMYFKQLFKTLELLALPEAQSLIHISYGIVNLPEGRMKSREGTVVDADDLVDELKNLVYEIIDSREEKVSKKEREKRALQIALAALKYYILEVNPRAEMVFNPKESISLHGRTGPYIQYTYARLMSIIRKSKKPLASIKKSMLPKQYVWEAEKTILLLLARYPQTVHEAATSYNPAHLAQYLYKLAKASNEFYHEHSVLGARTHERDARIAVTFSIALVLQKGLALLGIEVIEKM